MTAIETTSALHTLRRSFKGVVIEPGRNGWTSSTQAFNLSFTQEPELVAVPADERDVITIVDFARAHGLQVAALADFARQVEAGRRPAVSHR